MSLARPLVLAVSLCAPAWSGAALGKTVIAGKDFADALFAIWLGEHPVDDGLKQGLLGKQSL